jgi:hypothetical protein
MYIMKYIHVSCSYVVLPITMYAYHGKSNIELSFFSNFAKQILLIIQYFFVFVFTIIL